MEKLAFLFSGQGAQYAGMGCSLQRYSIGKETFREANDILGIDIAYLCCGGTDADLARTEITQPAIVTCSIAALRILNGDLRSSLLRALAIQAFGKGLSERGNAGASAPVASNGAPSAVAGLSVGEYSALVASEAICFADALKLVRERGRLMAQAAAAIPGTMAAILGLDSDIVESICQEASSSGVVSPANYNCPGQIIISGEREAVQKAIEIAKEAGARGCKVLNVSGAFHSRLMQPAESELRKALSKVSISKPQVPFIANVTGDYVEEPEQIREMLAFQLSNPIQWETSMHRMIEDGITKFVEVGPGKVLTGLMRRIHREAKIFNTDDLINLQAF